MRTVPAQPLAKMAKSKNHTNHNQNYKDHRHPIRVKGKNRTLSSKGLEQKLRKNRIRSRKGFLSSKKQQEIRDKMAHKHDDRRRKKYKRFLEKLPIWKSKQKADKEARRAAKAKEAAK